MPLYGVVELLQATPGSRVYVTEGEKSADALIANGLVAVATVTGAGGTPIDARLTPLLGYDVVLWPDNDAAPYTGQRHMERIANRLFALGAERAAKLHWPGAPEKGDAGDYVELGKPIDFLPDLTMLYAKPEKATSKYKLYSLAEAAKLPKPKPILGRVLSEEAIGILYGPSGTWKTFVALGWSLAIATGTEWFGLPVKQGTVIYVTGEGASHIPTRAEAWKRYYGVPEAPNFHLIRKMVPFLEDAEVADLIRAIAESLDDERPTLVVVDTLALAMVGGSENDSQDTSIMLTAAHRVKEAFGCAVLFIHHTGYDTSHMRGSTALYGNADTVIRVESKSQGSELAPGRPIRICSEKPRDDGPFPPITFTTALHTWPDPTSDEGYTTGSLVVVETLEQVRTAWPSETSPSKAKYGSAALEAWKALNKLCLLHPDGVTFGEWKMASLKNGAMTETTFKDSRRKLLADGWVRKHDKSYYASVPGEGPKIGTYELDLPEAPESEEE